MIPLGLLSCRVINVLRVITCYALMICFRVHLPVSVEMFILNFNCNVQMVHYPHFWFIILTSQLNIILKK